MGVSDFSDYDGELLLWKIGILTPLVENIYIDLGLRYATFTDDDYDHDGMLFTSVGLSYFWKK